MPPAGQSICLGIMRIAEAGPASAAMTPHTSSNAMRPIFLTAVLFADDVEVMPPKKSGDQK